MYEKQFAAIFHTKRWGYIEASTKAGKTTACMIWLIEKAITGKAEQNFWWIAPVYSQAAIAFRRFKYAMRAWNCETTESPMKIPLPNGATIWFKSAENPDNLYGEDVHAAVLDEASRMREAAFHAIRSTLTATRGPARLIGNVKGRQNFFYRGCRNAESGSVDSEYHKITAYDAAEAEVITYEEIESAKRDLPDNVFRELYLCEPSDDGGNPFGMADIEQCIAPLSDKPPAWWGWDLAKSVDWCVGIALDENGATCQIERFQKPWMETVAIILEKTGKTPAFVDSTGVGDPILEQLQAKSNNFEGYKFTSASKQQLMEGLAMAIQQRKITFPDGIIKRELLDFEYEHTRTGVRYSAPSGLHDDTVCALALAQRRRTQPIEGMAILEYYKREYEKQQAAEAKK
jgi:hypothetical protein